MSTFGDWFSPIKNALETVWSDLHDIFAPGGGGFTQANFVKLGLDIEAGVQVDLKQIEVGVKAVEVGIQQAIPIAQQAIADAQLVAQVYPAVEPFILEMSAALSIVQELDTILLNSTSTTPNPATIPEGIMALANLAKAIGGWAGQAIDAFKKGSSTRSA